VVEFLLLGPVQADEYGLAGRWQECADAQRVGLAAARRLGDRRGQADAQRSLGRALGWLRRYDDGYANPIRALDLFDELGDRADQANTQLGIPWLFDQQGRHREALDRDRLARALYATAGNRAGEATALTAIAWDLGQLGEHERSLAYTSVSATSLDLVARAARRRRPDVDVGPGDVDAYPDATLRDAVDRAAPGARLRRAEAAMLLLL
jgi:tetratricopeptide (TPR) repeat protein